MSTLGVYTLGELRTQSQQRADMVNSSFITNAEWTNYINESYFELYDLLVSKFGDDYYIGAPYNITMDGINFQFALPANFYKLVGVDVLIGNNFYVPIKTFSFGDRTPNYYTGSVPSAGQVVRLWFVPRMVELSSDGDTVDGVSGWGEYIIADVCIKALQKEESDTAVFERQKAALTQRIVDMAANRDAANPLTVTDSQAQVNGWPFAINTLYAPNILRYTLKGSNIWVINYGLGVGGGGGYGG